MRRRFYIRTFGCQMNHRDTENIANLLYHDEYRPATGLDDADLILIHTCSVREKAEHKLYSELGALLPRKQHERDLVVGVGGCVAQQEGAKLLRRFPALDFVFGSQNVRHIPAMVREARARSRALRVDYESDAQARFELPERHPEYASPTPGRAFVTVMEGCDLFCAYCVVPQTRGREVSRPSDSILSEVESLARRGVIEVTLLGQTVNAYGRPRPGRAAGELPFAELIRRIAKVPGIQRIRFTSPHPIFVTPDLIAAYAEVPALCPHLHLPVQSGSSRVLADMNRRYDRDQLLDLVHALRASRSDLALTTDLIVGFPGETEADFAETLDLVERVGFVDSFSFKYSARPGTPVLRRDLTPVDPNVAQSRLERLQALQRQLTLAAHTARVGEQTTVLVEGESRQGGQWTGRCPKNRIVNFASSAEGVPGRLATVSITGATPHSLLGVAADAPEAAVLPLL